MLRIAYVCEFLLALLAISVVWGQVGGQDQLSRFGALLNIEAYTCTDSAKLGELVHSLNDCDLILIDTPGASPSDIALLGRLEKVLKIPEARVNLVIAATTRSEDVGRILARFQRFAPQRIILTKIDETESRAAVVGDLLRYELNITFLTNGPTADAYASWATAGLARRRGPHRSAVE